MPNTSVPAAATGLPKSSVIRFPTPQKPGDFQPVSGLNAIKTDRQSWEAARRSACVALALCQSDRGAVTSLVNGMIEENPGELETILAAHEESLAFFKAVIGALEIAQERLALVLDQLNAKREA